MSSICLLRVSSLPFWHSHVLPRERAASFDETRHTRKIRFETLWVAWTRVSVSNTQQTQPMDRRRSKLTSSSKVCAMCHKLCSPGLMGCSFADGQYMFKIPEARCSMRSVCQKARASATRETAEVSLTIPLPCLSPRRRLCSKRASVPRGCKQMCIVTGFN